MSRSFNIICFFFLIVQAHAYGSPYVYITSHGIAATANVYRLWAPYYYIEEKKIANNRSTIFYPIASLNYQDSFRHSSVQGRFEKSLFSKAVGKVRTFFARVMRGWYFCSCLGQLDDIAYLAATIRKYCKNGQKVIIQGVSRGGSNPIPTVALNPDLPIAALILESPYADIEDVLNGIVEKLGGFRFLEKYKYQLLCLIFRKHVPGLYQPIDYVNKVSKEIPILIVCSTSDQLVPAESSIRLYKALIQSGHTKVHIVILTKGKHGFLLQGEDGWMYEKAVHAFYRQYGLPYDKSKLLP